MAKIRRFKEADAAAVARLSNRNAEFFQFPNVTPEFLKNFTDHPKFQMFVLEDEGIIGFCGVNFQTRDAEIGPICVENGKRRLGLGVMMVKEVMRFLRPKAASRVFIKVKTSNIGGQKFFEKLGFEVSKTDLCSGEPALVMVKEL